MTTVGAHLEEAGERVMCEEDAVGVFFSLFGPAAGGQVDARATPRFSQEGAIQVLP